jgi:cyclic pyranopterin phosphate synthase
MQELTHVDQQGKASMVDISDKPTQVRKAEATGCINLQPQTLTLIRDNQIKKGDVLSIARIAGIQAAKSTSSLIPLCHNLLLTHISIDFTINDTNIEVQGCARCTGATGVEMEALTGVSVALLTIYDMCKAVDKTMVISDIRLISKTKE